jgi:hypothetical protein
MLLTRDSVHLTRDSVLLTRDTVLQNNAEDTRLLVACRHGNLQQVVLLLQAGAEVMATPKASSSYCVYIHMGMIRVMTANGCCLSWHSCNCNAKSSMMVHGLNNVSRVMTKHLRCSGGFWETFHMFMLVGLCTCPYSVLSMSTGHCLNTM